MFINYAESIRKLQDENNALLERIEKLEGPSAQQKKEEPAKVNRVKRERECRGRD